ncbi:unnamed protein product [Camellia sinensis]
MEIVAHGGDGEGKEEEVGVGGISGEEEEEEDLQRNRDTRRRDLWRFYMERASNKVGRVTDDSGRSLCALSFSSLFAIITSAMGQVSRELAIHELLKLLRIGIYVIHWFVVADMKATYLVKVGGGCLIQMTFPSSKANLEAKYLIQMKLMPIGLTCLSIVNGSQWIPVELWKLWKNNQKAHWLILMVRMIGLNPHMKNQRNGRFAVAVKR